MDNKFIIPYFRAKALNKDYYVEGFYMAYPNTTYCFIEDYVRSPVKIIHCIVNHRMTDWGLSNESRITEIDIDTLEQIGYFDSQRKVYKDEPWIELISTKES